MCGNKERKKLLSLCLFLVAIFLIVSFNVRSESGLDQESQEAMSLGIKAAQNQDWQEAIEQFNKAREAHHYMPEILFNLALATEKKGGSPHAAICWYYAYLAASPDAANSGKVRAQIKKLESQIKTTVGELIRKAQEASTGAYDPNYPGKLAYALSEIVKAQATAGDIAAAKRIMSDVEVGYFKVSSLVSIGEAYLEQDEVQQALKYFEQARGMAEEDSGWTLVGADNALVEKASQYLDDENYSAALKTVAAIGRDYNKAKAISSIAKSMAEAAKFSAALDAAKTITNTGERDDAYATIAEEQAEAGNFSAAKRTAALISAIDFKALALSDIAKAQAKNGNIKSALETVDSISNDAENNFFKGLTYANIAHCQVKEGDAAGARESLQKALKFAENIDEAEYKAKVYLWIAEIQAKNKDYDDALKNLEIGLGETQNIKDSEEREYKLMDVAIVQVKLNNIKAAKETIAMIESNFRRSHAFTNIYQIQAETGNSKEAQDFLSEAVKSAEMISDESARNRAFHTIAIAQVEVGDYDGAKKTIGTNAYPYRKFLIYKDIAKKQNEAGNAQAADQIQPLIEKTFQENEIKAWTDAALKYLKGSKIFTDPTEFITSLKSEKEPDVVIRTIAEGATSLAAGLTEIRDKVITWKKFRKTKLQ